MPIVHYKGPLGFIGVLQHLVGERIEKTSVDAAGSLVRSPVWARVRDRGLELQRQVSVLDHGVVRGRGVGV